MNNKVFDENGFAIKDSRVKTYQYSQQDKEFIGVRMEHVVEGSGIPANSTLVENLELKDNFTQVFDEDSQNWSYVEDHRYDDVYNMHTKQKEDVRYIGALKAEHTLIAPPSFDHEFIDGAWIITEERKKELEQLDRLNSLNVKRSELDAINQEITMLKRITDRSEDEETELQGLNTRSVALFREIKSLEKAVNMKNDGETN